MPDYIDKDVLIALITVFGVIVVGVAAAVANVQASRNKARMDAAEQKTEDHEERLKQLEPAFGDSITHIRDLRGHIHRGDPPPPPPLPGSLVHYYYD